MDDIYKNIEENNPHKRSKILIVFDNMIVDMLSNKKRNPVIIELFIRGGKLIIVLVVITRSYFAVPKNIRLNSTNYFIIKIPNKLALQQTALNHLSDIDFINLLYYGSLQNHTKPYSFLVIDATLPSDNPLRFRKNLLERIWKLIMYNNGNWW